MTKLVWDAVGEHYYETGLTKGVLYPQKADGTYPKGVVWNGLTSLSETPSGAEATDLYADDQKYVSLYSAEKLNATLEAYTYPEEFEACDGTKEIATGVTISQQERSSFGLCYRTTVGSDTKTGDYKLHLIYGAKASPSQRAYKTINDSPEANTFSWEMTTNPVNVEGYKPTSLLVIDSRRVDADKLKTIEEALYGTDGENGTDPHLLTPGEVIEIIGGVEQVRELTESELENEIAG